MKNKTLPAILLNALLLPGVGTIVAKRHKEGILQIGLATGGICLFTYTATCAIQILTNHLYLLETQQVRTPLPADNNLAVFGTGAALGFALFLIAWVWSLTSCSPAKTNNTP